MAKNTEGQLNTESAMQRISILINTFFHELCGHDMGFALIVFEFNKPGVSNYISNANRTEMIEALRKAANKLESNHVISNCIGSA